MNLRRAVIFTLSMPVALIVFYWAFVNVRWTSLACAIVFYLSFLIPRIGLTRKRMIQITAVWLVISMSPLEISLYHVQNGPKIMRLVPGLVRNMAKGDTVPSGVNSDGTILYAGDVVGGMEPTWVIVW